MSIAFEGLIAAPFTPFRPDGELHIEQIERQAERLVRDGVCGAFVCGTTGEGASLTLDERMQVAERWNDVAGNELKIIVHVGHNTQKEAITLASHAAQIGAGATACIAPSFYKPATARDLAEFLAPVVKAAPGLPFYYYHLPALTGGNLRAVDVLQAMEGVIPNLAGVKFTHEDLMDFAACREFAAGRYKVLFGRDEIFLAGLAFGARGAVGSTYNFAAPLYLQMAQLFGEGNVQAARDKQMRICRFMSVLRVCGGLPAAKCVMAIAGVDCGPVRAPLRQPDEEAYERLQIAWHELNNP